MYKARLKLFIRWSLILFYLSELSVNVHLTSAHPHSDIGVACSLCITIKHSYQQQCV